MHCAHVGGVAAGGRLACGAVGRIADDAELGGEGDLVAPVGEQLGDETLVVAAAVHVRGVEERHAEVEARCSVASDSVSSTSPYTGVNAIAPKPMALTVRSSPRSRFRSCASLSSGGVDGSASNRRRRRCVPVVAFAPRRSDLAWCDPRHQGGRQCESQTC